MQTKDIMQGEVYAVHTGYAVPQDALSRSSDFDVERLKVLVTNVSFSTEYGTRYPLDMEAVVERGEHVQPKGSTYSRKSIKNGVLVEYLSDSRAEDYNDKKPRYRKGDRIVVKPQRILELWPERIERKRREKEQRERWDRERAEAKRKNEATAKRVNARVKKLGLTDAVGQPLDFHVYPDGSTAKHTFDVDRFENLLDQLGVDK